MPNIIYDYVNNYQTEKSSRTHKVSVPLTKPSAEKFVLRAISFFASQQNNPDLGY